MKFENIKIGDIIFVEKEVKFGWSSSECFYVPIKVTKTSNTQFSTEDGTRFRKEDGKKLGGSYGDYAKLKGEKKGHYSSDFVCDEADKMKEFEVKLSIERKLNDYFEKMKIKLNSHLSLSELKIIKSKVEEINKLINNEKD